MSADNYYIIRKDRQGFFVPVMGFRSNNGYPQVRATDPRFEDFHAAIEHASNDYAEYGITVHEECYGDELPVISRRLATGHYSSCPAQYNTEMQQFDCECAAIQSEWEKDYRLYVK